MIMRKCAPPSPHHLPLMAYDVPGMKHARDAGEQTPPWGVGGAALGRRPPRFSSLAVSENFPITNFSEISNSNVTCLDAET